MKKLLIPLVSLGVAVGCSESPTGTLSDDAPLLSVAGNSGCATVKFNWAGQFEGNWFEVSGPITGDLEGTFTMLWPVSGDTKFAGVTMKNGGTGHWDITGGVLGAFTFETEFDNKNLVIDRPGSPATLIQNMGKHRATNGVQKANLHYKGTFDAISGAADHDYQGVICP